MKLLGLGDGKSVDTLGKLMIGIKIINQSNLFLGVKLGLMGQKL